jgi:hypothetical protein
MLRRIIDGAQVKARLADVGFKAFSSAGRPSAACTPRRAIR